MKKMKQVVVEAHHRAGKHRANPNSQGRQPSRNTVSQTLSPKMGPSQQLQGIEEKVSSSDNSTSAQQEQLGGVFRLPLKRVPSLVDELLQHKTPAEMAELEKRIFKRLASKDSYTDSEPVTKKKKPNRRRSNESAKQASAHRLSRIDAETLRQSDKQEKSDMLNLTPRSIRGGSRESQDTLNVPQILTHSFQSSVIDQVQVNTISVGLMDNSRDSNESQERQMLSKLNNQLTLKLTSSASSQSIFGRRSSCFQTADHIAAILKKNQSERTKAEYEEVHQFMAKNVKMFTNKKAESILRKRRDRLAQGLSQEDSMRVYQVLMCKNFNKDDKICEFNQLGDRFYIILSGSVTVRQPKEIEAAYDSAWDLYNFIVAEYEQIRTFRDEHSKEVGAAVTTIGAPLLRDLAFKHVRELVNFLRHLEYQSEEVFQEHARLDRRRIVNGTPKIRGLLLRLRKQMDIIHETYSGSVTMTVPDDKKMRTRMQLMDEINTLQAGESFGQDSLLQETDCRRNATCQVVSQKAITAVLTKSDFQRVLFEQERQKVEAKIALISQFDMFKQVSKRKLKNMFRVFFNPRNEECYTASRNQYLYRQGDSVDGVYFLISGRVKRLKETWQLDAGETDTKKVKNHRASKKSLKKDASVATLLTVASVDQYIDTPLTMGVMNDLKRNKARQIVLTILEKGEVVGVQEVIEKESRRNHSVQVCSNEPCQFLFLSKKNFADKFYNHSFAMKKMLGDRNALAKRFHKDLESQRTIFSRQNNEMIENGQTTEVLTTKQDPPFSLKLAVNAAEDQKQQSPKKMRELVSKTSSRIQEPSIFANRPRTPEEKLASAVRKKEAPLVSMPTRAIDELSPMQQIEQKISSEMDRNRPNIKRLRDHLRERRQELAQEKQEQIRGDNQKMKQLSSNSQAGKIIEQNICKRYKLTHVEHDVQEHQLKQMHKDLSIVKITDKLGRDADKIYSKWKSERLQEEQLDLVLQSLTQDKRLQRQLRAFEEKLLFFLEFLREQGPDYQARLNLPVFEGSLLLSKKPKRTHIRTRNQRHASHRGTSNNASNFGRNLEHDSPDLSASAISSVTQQKLTFGGSSKQGEQENALRKTKTQMHFMREPSGDNEIHSLQLPVYMGKYRSQNSAGRSASHSRGPRQSSEGSHQSTKDGPLDLQKVFFDWFAYFQNTEMRRRNSTVSFRRSAEAIAERARQTMDLVIGPQLNVAKSVEMLTKFGSKRNSQASNASEPAQPSGLLNHPFTFSPVPLGQSSARTQQLTRQTNMIKNSTAPDQVSPLKEVNRVSFKGPVTQPEQRGLLGERRSSAGSTTRISRLPQTPMIIRMPNEMHRPLADTIPEEQYRTSILDSDVKTPYQQAGSALNSPYFNLKSKNATSERFDKLSRVELSPERRKADDSLERESDPELPDLKRESGSDFKTESSEEEAEQIVTNDVKLLSESTSIEVDKNSENQGTRQKFVTVPHKHENDHREFFTQTGYTEVVVNDEKRSELSETFKNVSKPAEQVSRPTNDSKDLAGSEDDQGLGQIAERLQQRAKLLSSKKRKLVTAQTQIHQKESDPLAKPQDSSSHAHNMFSFSYEQQRSINDQSTNQGEPGQTETHRNPNSNLFPTSLDIYSNQRLSMENATEYTADGSGSARKISKGISALKTIDFSRVIVSTERKSSLEKPFSEQKVHEMRLATSRLASAQLLPDKLNHDNKFRLRLHHYQQQGKPVKHNSVKNDPVSKHGKSWISPLEHRKLTQDCKKRDQLSKLSNPLNSLPREVLIPSLPQDNSYQLSMHAPGRMSLQQLKSRLHLGNFKLGSKLLLQPRDKGRNSLVFAAPSKQSDQDQPYYHAKGFAPTGQSRHLVGSSSFSQSGNTATSPGQLYETGIEMGPQPIHKQPSKASLQNFEGLHSAISITTPSHVRTSSLQPLTHQEHKHFATRKHSRSKAKKITTLNSEAMQKANAVARTTQTSALKERKPKKGGSVHALKIESQEYQKFTDRVIASAKHYFGPVDSGKRESEYNFKTVRASQQVLSSQQRHTVLIPVGQKKSQGQLKTGRNSRLLKSSYTKGEIVQGPNHFMSEATVPTTRRGSKDRVTPLTRHRQLSQRVLQPESRNPRKSSHIDNNPRSIVTIQSSMRSSARWQPKAQYATKQ